MSTLFDYLYAMEALPGDDRTGLGFAALILSATATGSCGTGTAGERPRDGVDPGEEWEDGYVPDKTGYIGIVLPAAALSALADWLPTGDVVLPAMQGGADQAGWRPAWGGAPFPACLALGTADTAVTCEGLLPPPFARGLSGAAGWMSLPAMGPVAADSGYSFQGAGAVVFPGLAGHAYDCSLSGRERFSALTEEVVALLGIGDPVLAEAAAGPLCGVSANDDKAAAILRHVSTHLVYEPDPDSDGVGDSWTCAAGTWFRGRGDCEDGAILIQGLLLAAGVPATRLVTVFGKTGLDLRGHAWTAYKRESDEAWTLLDWTAGAYPAQAGGQGLPCMLGARDYVAVDYALDAFGFIEARRSVAEFFARVEAARLVFPTLGCAGETNVRAAGTAVLFQASPLWESLSCRAGAGAATAGQGLQGPALAGLALKAMGAGQSANMRTAVPDCAAVVGALAAAVLAPPEASGRSGVRATARLATARLKTAARASEAARAFGQGAPPRLGARASGLSGMTARGQAAASPAALSGLCLQGFLGRAMAALGAFGSGTLGTSHLDANAGLDALCPWMDVAGRGTANAAAYDGLAVSYAKGANWR